MTPSLSRHWRPLLIVLLAGGLSACTTTRTNLGSDYIGALEPFAEESRIGPCGERYSAEEGMELSMVQQQLDEERPRSALAYLEALGYRYPEAQLMQADALRQIGQLERSREAYAALLDSCLEADGLRGLARSAFDQQRPMAALARMRQAREASPADARIRNDLGYLLLLSGEYHQAIEEFRTALEIDSSLDSAAGNLVLALLHDGQPQRAEAAARRYQVGDEALQAMHAAVMRAALPYTEPDQPASAVQSPVESPVENPVESHDHETP